MPMDFPDMAALADAALVHNFRVPNVGESEAAYRSALADHVKPIDFVESQEIRHGVGWDRWNTYQHKDMILRSFIRSDTPKRSKSANPGGWE